MNLRWSVPALVMADLTMHRAEFTDPASDAFVFLGELGGRLRRSNFRRALTGERPCSGSGYLPTSTSTICAHTGNQLAAKASATTKELMCRMDHSNRARRDALPALDGPSRPPDRSRDALSSEHQKGRST